MSADHSSSSPNVSSSRSSSSAQSSRRYTRLIGLQVDDAARYIQYRAGMTPILHAHGGAFGLDLEVARVLKAPSEGPLNRVFTISFPDREAYARFFASPDYLAVRTQHFEPAVSRVCILAEWDEP